MMPQVIDKRNGSNELCKTQHPSVQMQQIRLNELYQQSSLKDLYLKPVFKLVVSCNDVQWMDI